MPIDFDPNPPGFNPQPQGPPPNPQRSAFPEHPLVVPNPLNPHQATVQMLATGLTKREYMATHLFKEFMINNEKLPAKDLAILAVHAADTLLHQLAK